MRNSIGAAARATEVQSPDASGRTPERTGSALDHLRPTMAKAVHPHGLTLGAVVKAALQRHYGSLKAAAISLGIDQSQLTRELDSNKLAALERCDDAAKADVAHAIHEAYAAGDPTLRVRRLVRDARRAIDELAEAL